jgi:hypothetical protein
VHHGAAWKQGLPVPSTGEAMDAPVEEQENAPEDVAMVCSAD